MMIFTFFTKDTHFGDNGQNPNIYDWVVIQDRPGGNELAEPLGI